MAEYHTEQKKILINFLKKNCDKSFTVQEISDALELEGASVGKSTVYRLMTKLVKENLVHKHLSGESRKAVYRIALNESCHKHLHLQCVKCGKILHLDEKSSDELITAVKKLKDFSVSEEETVLLGKCSGCRSGGKMV